MEYREILEIDKSISKQIHHLLNDEPKTEAECFGENETISNTVTFKNGWQMDIKCCGVKFEEDSVNTAWTEAILYDDKKQQKGITEPFDEYLGEWAIGDYDNDDEYIVIVKEKES